MKLQKQYGDFLSYPYPLSAGDLRLIARTIERIRTEALVAFHSREREWDSAT